MKNEFWNINNLMRVETETNHTEFKWFEKVLDVYLTIWNYITFHKGEKKVYYYRLRLNDLNCIIGDTLEEIMEQVNTREYCKDKFSIVGDKIMVNPYVKLYFSDKSIAIRYFKREEDVKEYIKYILALKPSLQIELFSTVKI